MKISRSPPHVGAPTSKAPGRPSSLTKIEEQRYATLRNWGFSQREAGALARNLPRGRNGARPLVSASTCQRLDKLHGPFSETLRPPPGHNADSLRKLPERALVALADARGNVNNRKYLEAAGLRPVVKRAKPVKKRPFKVIEQPEQTMPRAVLPEESITYQAWHRANSVRNAFHMAPADTMEECFAYVRNWCLEWSFPVKLDPDARSHLTPWEQIAATWDGEFIADAARETLQLPFRNETHPKITPANQEAILSARKVMQSERPRSIRTFKLVPYVPEGSGDEWCDDEDLC